MARKPKKWSYSYGEYPDTVNVREKYVGGRLYLRSRLDNDAALGFKVRDADGRIDPDAERAARKAAEDRNLDLRLERTRGVTDPLRVTVGEGMALFRDADEGAMRRLSASARGMYDRLLDRWVAHLGADTPWQSLVRKQVTALLDTMKHGEGNPWEAWHALKVLRRVRSWLEADAGFDALKDPTKGIALNALVADVTVAKPRYTPEEARKLIGARHHPDLDPRWALFLALMDDSGRRGVSIRDLRRSDLNKPIPDAPPPPKEIAPHGWIWYAGRKGQKGMPHVLTAFEHQELARAFSTWLSELERAYRAGEIADYPLIPGEYLPESGVFTTEHAGAKVGVSYQTTKGWLRDAERVAGVEYVPKRGLHGIRRVWVDITRAALGLEGAQYGGGWSDLKTVQGYSEDYKWDVQQAARRVHEDKRRAKESED